MTYFKIYSWLIVLIVAGQGILMTEGRVLKSMKKQEQSNTLNVHEEPLRHVDNLQNSPADSVPSASLPVAEKKVTFPPQAAAQSQGYGSSEPESVNDFRPTTPGDSPGVGHPFTEHKLNTQSKAIGSGPAIPQSTTANGDDFRPTEPGHSPGGGHSKDRQIAKPNP